MDAIQYQKADGKITEEILKLFGSDLARLLHYGDHGYTVAALDGNTVAGFISVCPRVWEAPLETFADAFIDIIKVHPKYRRRGIASALVRAAEEWACEHGFTQIRSWSSTNQTEAVKMWHALEYGMCPAILPDPENGSPILGYYAVKYFRRLF